MTSDRVPMTLDDWLESATGQQVVDATRAEARRHEFLPVLSKCSCGWWATPEQGARGAISEWENHADKAALRAALGVRVEVPCAECWDMGCDACDGRGVVSGEPALIVGEQVGWQWIDDGTADGGLLPLGTTLRSDTRCKPVYRRLIPLEEETRTAEGTT